MVTFTVTVYDIIMITLMALELIGGLIFLARGKKDTGWLCFGMFTFIFALWYVKTFGGGM